MLKLIKSLSLFVTVTLMGAPALAGEAKIWNGLVTYDAFPGEANKVTITASGSAYQINDSGNFVVPGPGCTRVDHYTVSCPSAGITGLYADLHDLNDTLVNYTSTGINAQGGEGRDLLMGGGGNDTLLGGRLEDDLYGGPGNDVLVGGSEDDYLDGGTGNDYMAGESGNDKLLGAGGDDIIDGGEGQTHPYGWDRWDMCLFPTQFPCGDDIVTYELAAGPVSVRLYLTIQQDTVSDGKDTLSNVEIVYGSVFGDTLAGKDGVYHGYELHGGDGDDKLYSYGTHSTHAYYYGYNGISSGGRGNDTFDVVQGAATGKFQLYGGDGRDRLLGGDGTDYMYGEADVDYFDGRGGDDQIYANDGLGESVLRHPLI